MAPSSFPARPAAPRREVAFRPPPAVAADEPPVPAPVRAAAMAPPASASPKPTAPRASPPEVAAGNGEDLDPAEIDMAALGFGDSATTPVPADYPVVLMPEDTPVAAPLKLPTPQEAWQSLPAELREAMDTLLRASPRRVEALSPALAAKLGQA